VNPATLGAELARVLDEADRKRLELVELVKEKRGAIAKLEARALELRDALMGRGGLQTTLDDVLGEARAVASRDEPESSSAAVRRAMKPKGKAPPLAAFEERKAKAIEEGAAP